MKSAIENKSKMIYLDILRIFACFSVMAVHIAVTFDIPGRLGKFMEAGSSGLGIFYMLSGFLAFVSLSEYFCHENRPRGWVLRRLWRILPMYYFAVFYYIVFFEFIVGSVPEDPNKIKWLAYVLGINTILPEGPNMWYNVGALSSMSVFMWFYILAPLIKEVVSNWKRAVAFFAVCYVALRLLQHTTWLTMFRAYYYFALGILVYYAIKEQKEKITGAAFALGIMILILADTNGGLDYALATGLFMLMTYNLKISNEKICAVISFLSKRTFAIYIGHVMAIVTLSAVMPVKDGKFVLLLVIFTPVAIAVLYEGVERGAKLLQRRVAQKNVN